MQHPRKKHPNHPIKQRLPLEEMKPTIEAYFQEQREIFVGINGDSGFPSLESAEYRYIQGKHYMILNPGSLFVKEFQEGTEFTGYLKNKDGNGIRHTKRAYGHFLCHEKSSEDQVFLELRENDSSIAWMLAEGHRSKCFELSFDTLTLLLGMGEIYAMDSSMTPTFAPFTPSGIRRYENSRHVLMEYEGKDVMFNTLVEGNQYFTLTRADSGKMDYIKGGGVCQFFDGRDRHFSSKMEILSPEKLEAIHQTLKDTNHSYFEKTDGLVALGFQREYI